MKLAHFLASRGSSKLTASNAKDALKFLNFTSRLGISTAGQDLVTNVHSAAASDFRPLVDYPIFKGKAALRLTTVLPKFSKSRIEKKGSIMLTFWPAVGQRKYDWQKRQTFALSATEVGSLLSLGPQESCEMFHDPSMKTSLAGQVRKTLHVSPMPDDSGYLFTLTVVNSIQKTNERFSLPVSKAEFAVIRTSFNYLLPHLIGWHHLANPQPTTLNMNLAKQRDDLLSPDLEWGR